MIPNYIKRAIVRPRAAMFRVYRGIKEYITDVDYNKNGIDVFSENWDNCIILDACRYDVFSQRHSLSGRLEKRISRGGGTVEWLRGNIRGRDLRDVVYITANPQYYANQNELNAEFHDVWNIWQDTWDDNLQTVHPEKVVQKALQAAKKYPHKRLLIHFNQPHGPYLGQTGKNLVVGPGTTPVRNRSFIEDLKIMVSKERITQSEWRQAYAENFDLVESHIKPLLAELEGYTVVTADHGELLGERAWPFPFRYYNHQIGYHHDKLVTVPWLIHDEGKERETWPGNQSQIDTTDESVSSRLEDLGYVF